MVSIEIREDLSLFNHAFSVHQQIPEFQTDSTTYNELNERINNVKHPLILVAYVDNQPVGYLIGYERYSSFYIWITGLLPNYRRQGIFVQLMDQVEQWAIKESYKSLTIKTRNCFKSMLRFLISNDFKLIDIEKKHSVDTHRLILEKQLIKSEAIKDN
jgi:GNAT superfamily N-acetyltransferase